MACLRCGKSDNGNGYAFRAIEIHTLHIRDFGGERRVQSVGDFREFDICEECAELELQAAVSRKAALRRCLPFVVVFVLGAVLTLTVTVKSGVTALRIPGPAALFCGAAGCLSSLRDAARRARFMRGMNREDALRQSAWDSVLKFAPRKFNENDLTYIPQNFSDSSKEKQTPEDLITNYDLLPPIAERAFQLLQERGC